MPSPTILFPQVPVAEWSIANKRTAPGLFCYRQMQAMDLLELPDYGGGDLDAKQRREALRDAVNLHRPLCALSLFLGVVAVEDFIRDLATRLADTPSCTSRFPKLADLRSKPIHRLPEKMFKRLDSDPAGILEPEMINDAFKSAIGVEPVPLSEVWHLRDLALLRHTVAHHAGVIRHVDLPRFGHFIVAPGSLINPPIDFVKDELKYLFKLGRKIEQNVRNSIFKRFVADEGVGWSKSPSSEIIEMLTLFDFFGYVETTTVAVGYSEPGSELRQAQEVEADRIRTLLVRRCIEDLVMEFGP